MRLAQQRQKKGMQMGIHSQDMGSVRKETAGARRVNVNFSEPVYEMLDRLAKRRGTTMAEILRDAIALEAWVDEEREKGGRVLVERNGEVRELLLR